MWWMMYVLSLVIVVFNMMLAIVLRSYVSCILVITSMFARVKTTARLHYQLAHMSESSGANALYVGTRSPLPNTQTRGASSAKLETKSLSLAPKLVVELVRVNVRVGIMRVLTVLR